MASQRLAACRGNGACARLLIVVVVREAHRIMTGSALPTRRTVLTAAGAVAAGAALAACGGENDDDAGTSTGGTTPSPEDTAAGGGGDVLVAGAEVPVRGGVILADQELVVTQPESGTYKAFSAICTHQACTVGSVEDDVIMCPCHGSRYSADDGSVLNGPATRALAETAVTFDGTNVVRA